MSCFGQQIFEHTPIAYVLPYHCRYRMHTCSTGHRKIHKMWISQPNFPRLPSNKACWPFWQYSISPMAIHNCFTKTGNRFGSSTTLVHGTAETVLPNVHVYICMQLFCHPLSIFKHSGITHFKYPHIYLCKYTYTLLYSVPIPVEWSWNHAIILHFCYIFN